MTVDAPTHLPPAGTARAQMRLAAAGRAAEARLDATITDLTLDDPHRPDEQRRAAAQAILAAVVSETTQAIAAHAARLLGTAAPASAPLPPEQVAAVYDRLATAELLSNRALMHAVLTAAKTMLLDASLVKTRAPDEAALLLPRLVDDGDPLVRDRVTAFLLADSRRRREAVPAPELPAEVAHRLAWLVAAALASEWGEGDVAIARALAEAADRHIASFDEDRYTTAAAVMLAATLDADAQHRADVLVDALVDGRVILFAALLAHATGVEHALALDAALDPDPATLLTMLRAAGLEREAVARIGLRLLEADRARDADVLADEVDAAGALTIEDARAAIAPLTLDRDYRDAVRALERGAR